MECRLYSVFSVRKIRRLYKVPLWSGERFTWNYIYIPFKHSKKKINLPRIADFANYSFTTQAIKHIFGCIYDYRQYLKGTNFKQMLKVHCTIHKIGDQTYICLNMFSQEMKRVNPHRNVWQLHFHFYLE